MTFFSDESIEAEVSSFLREKGHTVFSIAELTPSISDDEVLEFAVRYGAILLTNDKDFGDLVKRQGLPHCGIILARLRKMPGSEKAKKIFDVISRHENELAFALTVITPTTVRIRKEV